MQKSPASPPRWFIVLTAAFTLLVLMMAVAETTLWTHFLIDQGEYVCLAGLALVLIAGYSLHRQHRLWVSLPLALPWLLYPVVTQGDQIIDNLGINQMRLVVHMILGLLFGAPVAVLVMAARYFLERGDAGGQRHRPWTWTVPGLRQLETGQTREGTCYLALSLLLLEMWVAQQFLGTLMIVTLIVMGVGYLLVLSVRSEHSRPLFSRDRTEMLALRILVAGVVLSVSLYLGFKNRSGAYQGSPHAFHDPGQKDTLYSLEAIPVATGSLEIPAADAAEELRAILSDYGLALKDMYRGYYILDRNYNYHFHNELFLRSTPLLPDYRTRGLAEIDRARDTAHDADRRLEAMRQRIPGGPLTALVDDVCAYVAYSLRRAALLEEMTGRFEKTKNGLQHATHVYEGEGKMLGAVLKQILEKHQATLRSPQVSGLFQTFVTSGEEVYQAYANRIVGF